MATGSAGSLVVSLGLNAAEFVSGLTKSEYQARQFAQQMQNVGRQIGNALGISITAAAAGLVYMTKNAIDAADHLNDLSKSTGIAVETLGGLGFAASQAGTNLEGVGKAVGKLNIQIAGAVAGNAQAKEAFTALGISMAELKNSSPDEVLAKIADRFATYEDGPNKAALALRFFGKSYQEIIPLLDEGGRKLTDNIAYFKKYGGVTTEVAQEADQFNDTLRKLELLAGSFGRTLAAELLPSLQAIGTEFLTAKEKGDQFKGAAADVADVLKAIAVATVYTATAFSQLGTVIGGYAAKLNALAHLDFKGFTFIGDELTKDLDASSARLDKFVAAIRNTQKVGTDAFVGPLQPTAKRRQAPGLPGGNAGGALDDPTKKILDGQIKALEDNIASEKDLLRTREEFIAVSFNQGYLSIKDSFDRTQEARDEALRNTIGFYDQEIALQRAFAAKQGQTEVNRADAANKIAEYQAKQAKAIGDSIVDTQRQAIARTIADDQYAAQLDELNAKVQELAGNTARAAAIRFGTSQNTPFFRSLTPEARDQFNLIGKQEIAQKALNDKNTEFRFILDAVGTAQEKINLLQQTGAISEIDALLAQSAAAKSQIIVLTELADKAEIAAQALTGIAKLEAIANVERLRLEIAKLGSQTDLLGDKFQNIFKTSFVDNLTAAIAGTKSWADAFKDAEKQIVESISRIAAQNIGDALFGKEGPLGGLGSMFGQIFGGTIGGGKAGSGATAADAALGTLSLTSATVTAAFSAITTSASLAASALATVAGSSSASSIGGLAGLFSGIFGGGGGGLGQFDAVSGYAKGTDFHPGGLAWVGEGGKELLNLPRGTQVIPQDKLRGMGRPNLSIVVNVPQGTSGPSADQIGVRVGAHVQRALNRNS